MHAEVPLARRTDRFALRHAEAAIVRGEERILRQRLTIAAAARAGIDPAFDKTFLAAMERNLAELNTWRRHLLDKLDADLP
jgi:hypothetical protein